MSVKLTPELAKKIGDKLNVDFSVIPMEEFFAGIQSEMEHKDVVDPNSPDDTSVRDLVKYAMIAHTHLKEMPDYYSKLKKMESGELHEIHFPATAIDVNKLRDADSFWGWSISKASDASGVKEIGPPFKVVGDVIFWLNTVAKAWSEGKHK